MGNLTVGIDLGGRTITSSIPANTQVSSLKYIAKVDSNNYIAENSNKGYIHYINGSNQEVTTYFYDLANNINLGSFDIPEGFGAISEIDETSVLYQYLTRGEHEKTYLITEDGGKVPGLPKDNQPITPLTENLMLVDSSVCPLPDGLYYSGNYAVYVNGTRDSKFNGTIFKVSQSRKNLQPIPLNVYTLKYEVAYVNNHWSSGLINFEIGATYNPTDDNIKTILTTYGTKQLFNNALVVTGSYVGEYDISTGLGIDPQNVSLGFTPRAVIVIGISSGEPSIFKYFIGVGMNDFGYGGFGIDVFGMDNTTTTIGKNEVKTKTNGFYAHGFANLSDCVYNYIAIS